MMLDRIKNVVAEFVQKNANMEEWKSIRKCYFWYSFLTFVNLYILNNGYIDIEPAYKELVKKNILDSEVLDCLEEITDRKEFFIKVQHLVNGNCDLVSLYQEYMDADFYIDETGTFYIGKGKDSRDILGSYFTQNDFANIIIKKVLDNYIKTYKETRQINKNMEVDTKEVLLSSKYMDSSCGAGEFLVSVIRYMVNNFDLMIDEREELLSKIYGYDVDPISVFITRVRIMEELHLEHSSKNIQLGNPLMLKKGKNIREKYMWASEGRFYNIGMGINFLGEKYDIIVGNPPWEKIRFEEKNF